MRVRKTLFNVLILCLLLALPMEITAQRFRKYRMEIGVVGGGSFGLGDANSKLFVYTQPSFGGFMKYKINGHWEVKLDGHGGWSGVGIVNDEQVKMPYGALSAMIEFNFFNFGGTPYEAYASKVSPYLFWGLGMNVFKDGVAAQMPFGLGVKWKVTPRFNIGAYWQMAKLTSDKFDTVDDPYKLNQNFLVNRDWNSTVGIYLSFDFWRICAKCQNHAYYLNKNGFNRSDW